MFEKLSIDSLTTTMTDGAYRLWDTAKGYFVAESVRDDKDDHQTKTQDNQDDEKTSTSLLSTDQQGINWSIPHPKKLLMLASLGLAYYTHQIGYHDNYANQGADISYAINGMDFTSYVPFQTTSDWSFAISPSTETFSQLAMLYGTSSLLSQSYQYNAANLLIAPLSLMALSSFLTTLPAQTIETEFFKVFGGSSNDLGYAVKTTSTGDIVLTGTTASFGSGNDVFVAKFYVNASLAWMRTLGGSSGDYAYALALTSTDDIVVGGSTENFGAGIRDMLIVKLYANGSLAWVRTLGGSNNDEMNAIDLTPDDDIVVAGYTQSFGVQVQDVLIAKLYANGSFAWASTFGGNNNDVALGLAFTSIGDIVVAGNTASFGAGLMDVLVAKLYTDGSLAWARTLGAIGTDYGQSLALTAFEDIVLTGYTYSFGAGNSDALVIKLDANGNLIWAQTLGGSSYDIAQALTLTPADDIVLMGTTTSFGAGFSDALIAKLHANSSLIWARTLGGSDYDRAQAIAALTPTDNIVVTGYISNIPNADIFVAKLNSNGTIPGCNLTRAVQPTLLSWSSISNNVVVPSFISLTAGILQNWANITTQIITPQLLNLCFVERNISMNNSFSSVSSTSFVSSSSTTLTSNNSPSTQTLTPTTVSLSTPTSVVTPSSVFAPMPASAPSSALTNLPPVLQTNYLIMTTGSTMTYPALNINAMDDLTPAANLIFIVSQVSNGHFQTSTDTTPIYSFTQQQLQNREIQFVHDGSNNPPSYQVHVNDGSLNSLPQWAAITFNNNAIPVLVNNQITISTGQTVILNNVNLNATDADINNADNLVFTVSDIQHGFFANTTNPNVPITTFTQGDINAGIIQFTHDGSNDYPSYYVSVSDGTFNTPPSLVNINFNNHFIPIILNNQFFIVPGQNTIIGIENIGGLDLNGNSNTLIFTVSNLSGGQFELVNNPGVGILQFTQQDIIDGNVLFTPDAVDCTNPTSSSYNLQASDGSYSTLFNIASIDYNTYTTTHGCVITTSSEQDNTALYAGVGVSAVVAVGATLTALGIFAVKQRHQRERTAERINEMDEMAQYAAKYKNQPL